MYNLRKIKLNITDEETGKMERYSITKIQIKFHVLCTNLKGFRIILFNLVVRQIICLFLL